jgi:hypothetical protein
MKMSPHITPFPKTTLTDRADWTICIVWLNRKTVNTTIRKAETAKAIFLAVLGITALRPIVSTILARSAAKSVPKGSFAIGDAEARLKESLSHLSVALLGSA